MITKVGDINALASSTMVHSGDYTGRFHKVRRVLFHDRSSSSYLIDFSFFIDFLLVCLLGILKDHYLSDCVYCSSFQIMLVRKTNAY